MSGRRMAAYLVTVWITLAGAAQADRVAYEGQFVLGVRGVMVQSEVGKNPAVLPQVPDAGQDNITPSLSPDGNQVAFAAKTEDHFQIFVWRVGPGNQVTGEPRQLTSGDMDCILPVWSPDGSRIAYVAAGGDQYGLYVMPADGANPIKVADLTADYKTASPTWSPDGARIAFSREGQLWLVGSDGAGLEKLRDDGSSPAWSRDGSVIAYIEREPQPSLVTITPDGEQRRVLVRGLRDFGGITWGPGGTRIAFKALKLNDKPGNLWVVNADGSDPRPMKTYGLAQGEVSWQAVAEAPAPTAVATTAATTPTELEPVVLLSPAPQAEVRGKVDLIAAKQDPGGYVLFRADDRFLFATAPPFRYEWDTRRIRDGDILVEALGYDENANLEGTAALTVNVHNAIAESELPPEGVLLRAKLSRDSRWVSQVRGVSSIYGGSQTGANLLAALDSRLIASLTQRIEDVAPDGSSASIATRLDGSTLTRVGRDVTLPLTGRSSRATLLATGVIQPLTGQSATIRIGLGELSIGFPLAPVKVGDEWTAPIVTITDLPSEKVVQLQARHVVEGLQWFGDYRAVRIKSTYTMPMTQLTGGVAPRPTTPAYGRPAPPPPSGDDDDDDDDDDQGAPPPRRVAPPPSVPRTSLPPGVQLLNASGTRTTWFAYEAGRVLRIEETLQGRVQVGAESLDYTMSLVVTSQPTAATVY